MAAAIVWPRARRATRRVLLESRRCRSAGSSIDHAMSDRHCEWSFAKGVIAMSEFVLLYRSSNEAYKEATASPEGTQQAMAKWRAWFKVLTEKGQLKNIGHPLDRSSGRVVGGKKKTVTDGPYVEAKEVLGGFSIIDARDLNEAAQIAAGCPILELGGSVEVRSVVNLPGTRLEESDVAHAN